MFSVVNVARIALAKLISSLYVINSIFGAGISLSCASLPATPSDFTPVVRFAVCSDIHLKEDASCVEASRFAEMLQTVYKYAGEQEYDKVDALLVGGDMTDDGLATQYDLFNSILEANLRSDTELIVCTGNHEYIAYRDYDASLGNKMFCEKMNRAENNHIVINGYHFISVSYSDDGKTFTDRAEWLDSEIKAAVADSGDKPVFVMNHPAPMATVYGSISWGDLTIHSVLSKYPQVIDFSGHSHYPVNDPRSIWQGSFTALGCGTLSYFETDLDGIAGNFPYNNNEAAQFYIVEADADGNVRIMSYDLITGQFYDNEYYLTGLAKRNFEYSYLKMKAYDSAPVFEDDTVINTSVNKKGETVLYFTGATDKFVTESYKVSVTENFMPFFSDNFSGKYMYLGEEDCYYVNLGVLTSGKTYRVSIVALNAYAETSSPLEYSFTA